MLLTQTPNQIVGDLGGEKIEYTVDQTALSHIMNVLTELYSDPLKAVIREISTNALDSHAISGQTLPIKITTPSRVNGFFIVEDFGAGMSPDDLRNVYSSYGASTKRGNNIEAGQLGLGSKSPFAIADQFTIRARKDGVETLAMLSRNANRSAQIEIVSQEQTDKPNGVRLQIPISGDLHLFNRKVDEFVRYVRPGLIDLNGEINELPEHWLQLSDDIYVNTNNYYGESGHQRDSVMVMGNVAYPASRLETNISSAIIAYVPMGSLAFTPSREELMYIDLTRATLKKVEADVDKLAQDYIKEKFAQIKTPHEKMILFKSLVSISPSTDWKSHDDLNQLFPTMELRTYADKVSYSSDIYYHMFRGNKQTNVTHVVYNCARSKGDRQLFNGTGATNGDTVVIFDGTEQEAKTYFPNSTLVNNKTMKRQPRQRSTNTKSVPKETYENTSGRYVPESDLKSLSKILYVAKSAYADHHSVAVRKGEMVVFVPPAKQEAFVKKFPNAAPLSETFYERRAKIEAFVRPHLYGYNDKVQYMAALGPILNRIDDEDVDHDVRQAIRGLKMNRLASKWGIYGSHERIDFQSLNKYPLLSELCRYSYRPGNLDHIVYYIKGVQDHG